MSQILKQNVAGGKNVARVFRCINQLETEIENRALAVFPAYTEKFIVLKDLAYFLKYCDYFWRIGSWIF